MPEWTYSIFPFWGPDHFIGCFSLDSVRLKVAF